jgi:4'-phosphopantetheinyl transferase
MSHTLLQASSLDALDGLWLHPLHAPPSPPEIACLSPAELARASRFLRERDRRRFLAARCALRQRLAQHLGLAAGTLRFVLGPEGKPALADGPGCHFNLSHSEDLALVAISERCEIGVDIEVLRPVDGAESLARSHFTAAEFDAFMALDEAARDEAFLRIWTRKEACLKALGTGLSVAPSSFEAGLGPQRRDLAIERPAGAVPLSVCSIDPGVPAVAAVAAVAWLSDAV